MSASAGPAVVVMSYGTVSSLDDLEEYYTHIRRGRPPSEEQLATLASRYEAIGGISELARRSEDQRAAIERHLADLAGDHVRCIAGAKHAAPFIEDAVEELARDGHHPIVGVVLAPHYSAASVGTYHDRAQATAAEHGVTYVGVERWYSLPPHVAFHARAIGDVLPTMPATTKIVFTAHSLPERVLVGDPYPDELHDGASQIARAAGLGRWAGWGIAWQSAGATPEPWRGPDVLDVIDDLADTGRSDGLLVVPHGFTSDHLEVKYDLDIEARQRARDVGLAFERTEVLCDDDATMRALAGVVDRNIRAADGTGGHG